MLTLTGWVAVAGVFALVTLVMALGVALARRYSGAGEPAPCPSSEQCHPTLLLSLSCMPCACILAWARPPLAPPCRALPC